MATAVFNTNSNDTHGLSHFKIERITSIALMGILPAALIAPGTTVDFALACVLPFHTTYGLDMIITDYVHGSVVPALRLVNFAFGATAVGLFVDEPYIHSYYLHLVHRVHVSESLRLRRHRYDSWHMVALSTKPTINSAA